VLGGTPVGTLSSSRRTRTSLMSFARWKGRSARARRLFPKLTWPILDFFSAPKTHLQRPSLGHRRCTAPSARHSATPEPPPSYQRVALVPYQSLAGEVGSGGDGEETLVAALVNLLRPALLSLFVQVLTHSAQCTYPRYHLLVFHSLIILFFWCRVARQCSTRARRSGDGAATRKAPFAF
jgi:hypothetical protein